MKSTALPAAAMVAFVLLLGFYRVPWVAIPLGAALFLTWLVLSAPDRRAARARKAAQR